jgi:hypothetical protein
MFSVHIFACIFYRVKVASASTPEDVTAFYVSNDILDDVSFHMRKSNERNECFSSEFLFLSSL